MKINKNPIATTYKPNLLSNIKCFLKKSNLKLKLLIKDVYHKEKNNVEYFSRGIPNNIESPKDVYNCKSGFIKYYQEDIEKMKNMSKEDIIEFKRELRKQKKYYIE